MICLVDFIVQDRLTGDLWKIYNYYRDRDGDGWVGIVLHFLLYGIVTFINGILFYFYLVFVHMNGRVIDLYYRLNGDIDAFFLPRDDEVSLNYLKWVCHKALKRNQRVANELDDAWDEKKRAKVKINFVHIYQFEKEREEGEDRQFYTGRLLKYRGFVRDYDGSIREIHVD